MIEIKYDVLKKMTALEMMDFLYMAGLINVSYTNDVILLSRKNMEVDNE